MKNTLETRLGIFFALALIAAFLIMEMIGSFDFFKRGIRVHAQFNTVQELKEGDPVKIAGVQVGRVEKIDLLEDKVDVTMKLNKPDNVRTDSKAIVKFAGLMGQNFVEIRFGSATAPKADNHTLINSEEQPDLSMLMARLDKVASGIERATASISGESFEKLLAPLTDFVKENSPRLTAILSNIKTISTQVAEGKGTVGRLINEDTFYQSALAAVTNLNETASEIKATVSQAKNVVAEINEGKGTIGKLAKAVNGPLNILAGLATPPIARIEQLGVARVSFGSWPHRAALGLFSRFVAELSGLGTFRVLADLAIPYSELNKLVE